MDGWGFALGAEVRDRVTGFDGTVTGRAEYISGSRRYGVEASIDVDGKLREHWFDEGRLEPAGP